MRRMTISLDTRLAPTGSKAPEREPSYQLGPSRQPRRFTALHQFTWAFLASLTAR